jgi:hypothetical protein
MGETIKPAPAMVKDKNPATNKANNFPFIIFTCYWGFPLKLV